MVRVEWDDYMVDCKKLPIPEWYRNRLDDLRWAEGGIVLGSRALRYFQKKRRNPHD
jgi:hypothetical protein